MKLKVLIQPNAKKNEVVGIYNDSIKIKIKSPPIDGKANETLIKFLSETLNISKKNITLLHGLTGKNKLIEITSKLTESQIVELLISGAVNKIH